MKRILFDRLDNSFNTTIVFISIALLFTSATFGERLGVYEVIIDKAFFIFQLMFFGKYFIYKRTVNWNKAGINIRLKWFKDAHIPFSNIAACTCNNKTLEIIKSNGKTYNFDLSDIHYRDKAKLIGIFQERLPNAQFHNI
ncbi:hypothetical protein INR75_10610 [Zunongwangia sp. SCSIO 43204]|uniref:EbsA family protein n=1 Tax=Zunongwangia sp. SCSIO 43204 TaxID=2779359 RepID=UPI001CA82A46|nr:EbsA family protein [Zunongwangia sp. SCSIO 43204]UAB82693.1 hypothetical protein INR75_10610 [Zunongwangia sp. SCSIO 43204]